MLEWKKHRRRRHYKRKKFFPWGETWRRKKKNPSFVFRDVSWKRKSCRKSGGITKHKRYKQRSEMRPNFSCCCGNDATLGVKLRHIYICSAQRVSRRTPLVGKEKGKINGWWRCVRERECFWHRFGIEFCYLVRAVAVVVVLRVRVLFKTSFARNHFVENAKNMNSGSRVTLMDFLSKIYFETKLSRCWSMFTWKGFFATRLFSNLLGNQIKSRLLRPSRAFLEFFFDGEWAFALV